MKSRLIYLCVLLFSVSYGSFAAENQDSLKVSLLTCSPGQEVYSLYGHTAVRVQNIRTGEDWVFNYGMFSFSTPNFLMRFVKGETDYELGVMPFDYFTQEYKERGSFVRQQVLNLSPKEAKTLAVLLAENYMPQNRVYRYNYFYDNCTTRARDKIEESIEGKVLYPKFDETVSFRQIVHEYTKEHPWAEFGVDLCLGSQADSPIDTRKQMFAPFNMLQAAHIAKIKNLDGTERPLIRVEENIVQPANQNIEKEFPLSPMQVSVFLFVITLTLCLLQLKIKRIFWGIDLFWFALQGLSGCIIAFLFFFSEHPTVGSNYLIIILNPLPLFYLPRLLYCDFKHKKDHYHYVNIVVLTLFVLLWGVIPQKISPVVLPLASSLLVISITHLVLENKIKK